MTGLSEGQLQVARLLFDLPEARDFALAGGSALLALGTIDRPTRDIDAFVAAKAETPPGNVGELAAALRDRLLAEGWAVEIDRRLVTFARFVVTRDAEAVEIDLAVDSPALFPLEVVDGLPVLSGPDLAARKVLEPKDATSPTSRRWPSSSRRTSASDGRGNSTPGSDHRTSQRR